MSYTRVTLEGIISRSFDGKKTNLAAAANLAPRVITKLTQDQSLTPHTLQALTAALPPDDARALALAACRDLLPEEFAEEITLESFAATIAEPPPNHGPPVDEKSDRILRQLRSLVSRDPETREWLHKLASWIFPE